MTPAAQRELPHAPSLDLAQCAMRWIAEGPAQLRSGPHAGAVAGVVDDSGNARYVYPEITGYFLQWLAWRAGLGHDIANVRERAAAAQAWLARWAAAEQPATRVYLAGEHDDWRNRSVFTFDLAMVLRGLASASGARLIEADEELVDRICQHLALLVGHDGQFDACSTHGAEPLPRRWSTMRGAFLAKAAAGVLAARRTLRVPRRLEEAARATLAAATVKLESEPHEEVHPLLYAYEGLASAHRDAEWWRARSALARPLALLVQQAAHGALRERGTAGGPQRVDILAQLVRMCDALAAMTVEVAEAAAVSALRDGLERCVDARGTVPFAIDDDGQGANVWAAMFVTQALVGGAHAPHADPLIV